MEEEKILTLKVSDIQCFCIAWRNVMYSITSVHYRKVQVYKTKETGTLFYRQSEMQGSFSLLLL